MLPAAVARAEGMARQVTARHVVRGRGRPPGREGPYLDPTCTDNIDNDCDDYIDASDPDCTGGGGVYRRDEILGTVRLFYCHLRGVGYFLLYLAEGHHRLAVVAF